MATIHKITAEFLLLILTAYVVPNQALLKEGTLNIHASLCNHWKGCGMLFQLAFIYMYTYRKYYCRISALALLAEFKN